MDLPHLAKTSAAVKLRDYGTSRVNSPIFGINSLSTSNSRTAQHFHGVTMPTGAHPDIRRIRRAGTHPNIHGNKLWKSSCLLIDYLQQHPPEHTAKVLDVGCGWGIAGIWCARHFGSQVTSVDADPKVFPFLDATAKINGVTTETRVSRF